MRNRNWMFLALILFSVLLVSSVCSAKEKVFKLKWGHYLAAGPFLQVEQDFAKSVEQRSNGRIKIDIVYSQGLGKGSEVFTLAGRGAIDMAAAAPGYYADQLLFWKALQIPMLFDSPREAMDVLFKSIEEFPIFMKEMDKMNLHWLFQQPLGSYWLTGKTPVDKIEVLKGKKIRSFGMYIPKAHRAVGAVPVNVMPVEVYEGLQRGVIDYSFINLGNVDAYRLYEVGKYSSGPIMAITGHNIVIGKPTWNKLPDDLKEIFSDEAKKAQKKYLDWVDDNDKQARIAIKDGGGEIINFPSEEKAKWKEICPDLLEIWVKDCEKRGYGDTARRVAKRWRELLK